MCLCQRAALALFQSKSIPQNAVVSKLSCGLLSPGAQKPVSFLENILGARYDGYGNPV